MSKSDALRLSWLRQVVENGQAQRIRTEARLSRTEAADAAGVSSSAIWQWETGGRRPRGAAALRYAELLLELEKAPA